MVIEALSHDGRGVARVDGKTVFVAGALPGERVQVQYTGRRRDFDEGRTASVIDASPARVSPRCVHYAACGGCSVQHLDPPQQVRAKQEVLLDNLLRIGRVSPDSVLSPLTGPHWGYRRKARLGVKYVAKKQKVLVGFREPQSSLIADLRRCEVLHPAVGERLEELAELVAGLELYNRIPQIEVAVADEVAALVFRVLEAVGHKDWQSLADYGRATGIHVYIQPGGPDTLQLLWPDASHLTYRLPAHGLELQFSPVDFTQINADINRAMIDRTLELLAAGAQDCVLDLFCGLGNFSLPIARQAARVVGIEGDPRLVDRARANAERNGIENAEFHAADLAGALDELPWMRERYDKVVLDPPRSGAAGVVELVGRCAPRSIVYVSCHPGTLARDAGALVHRHGYSLAAAGVMDMFPHTAHVESIALFCRS